MVGQLQPWSESLGKRQVKSPKVYLWDSGILHDLLSLGDHEALFGHPAVGASWDGFALEQVLRLTSTRDAYFWSTQNGAELDLFIFKDGKRIGWEFKYSEHPSVNRSMRIAMEDLRLDQLWVICPGYVRARLDQRIEVCGMAAWRISLP
jgi:predicted AAA+ superfamily ATPase